MSETAGGIYLSLQRVSGVTILRAHGLVNAASAGSLREKVTTAVDRGARRIVVDISNLEIVDSAGILALLDCERHARQHQGRLVLGAVPQDVVDVLCETGAHRVLLCFRTTQGALDRLYQGVA